MKLESVELGNGDGLHASDLVGAAVPWSPPDLFEGLSTRDLYNVQIAISAGEFGADVQAKDWAGQAVADALGLDLDDEMQKNRVKSLIKTWKANKAFKVEKRTAGNGKERPFLMVREWVDPAALPTFQRGVEKVAKVGCATNPATTSTTTPIIGGGGGGGGDMNASAKVVQ
jgi:hypothetical protein